MPPKPASETSLWVSLDRTHYFGGDEVKGVVCLNVVKPLKADGVELKVGRGASQR